jgi:hypothetical protein
MSNAHPVLPGEPLRGAPPPVLHHTRLVRTTHGPQREVCYWLWVNRWGRDNDTFGDPLPFNSKIGSGPYAKFIPWNQWLGEQLMYADGKGEPLRLLPAEVLDFIAVANYAARDPEALKAKAKLIRW